MSDIGEKWDKIKEQIRAEGIMANVAFETWIKPLVFSHVTDDIIYIFIPDDQANFKVDYISKKYKDIIMVTISEFMNDHKYKDIVFTNINSEESSPKTVEEDKVFNINSETANLNINYKFDSFVVGNNNRMAHAASLYVAENPGNSGYNPLYLYGNSGLGKTHLMQAIGHFILENNPNKKVLYVTSEQFTNEVVENIRSGNDNAIKKLREKYRTVDVLMLDDVQFIIGKQSTQEEFFHTFNELHSQGKQIILTSDRKPNELNVDDRFKGRFNMGLSTFIEKPDYETRIAILMKKAEKMKFDVDKDVLAYIAENINSNIRDLEGALSKVHFYSLLNKVDMNVSLAEEALKDIVNPFATKEITPSYIIEVVAEHYNINKDDIVSKKRTNEISLPRQICMYLMKEYTDIPLVKIGDALGKKDHSTVIHGINNIEDKIKSDKELAFKIDTIKKKLQPI